MKKVFCDDRISVWQDGDKFIGETGPNDKPNLKNLPARFNTIEEAANFARGVNKMVDDFVAEMGW